MLIITNPDAQILAAEAGELDILSDIARPSDIDRLGADPKLKMSLARGMHAFFLLLNNKNFPWDDAAVRRAAANIVMYCNTEKSFRDVTVFADDNPLD